MEQNNYRSCLFFTWGYLEDGSIWVQPPTNNIFSIDYNTLMAFYDLNGGVSAANVARKYAVAEQEVNELLSRLEREGMIVSPCCGRIVFENDRSDIPLAGYLLAFLALIFIQIEYFRGFARTFFVQEWYEALLLTLVAIGVIFFHELGHYFFARKFLRGKPKISFGFSLIFPTVYVDTHEAWRLPRNKRLLINSSGLFADCLVNVTLIAAAVNFPALERFVTPLILAQFTRLSLILNPLFPTDGYWLLADLTRSVNLGQTASENLKKLKPNLYSLYALLALGFSAFSAAGLGWYLVNLLSGLWSRLGL